MSLSDFVATNGNDQCYIFIDNELFRNDMVAKNFDLWCYPGVSYEDVGVVIVCPRCCIACFCCLDLVISAEIAKICNSEAGT